MVEVRFKPGDVGTIADGGISSMAKFPGGVTDPETPTDQDIFFNTADNKFKRYETDHWVIIDHLEALGQIADGLITNAKINEAAAITKTKLAALEIENSDVKTDAAIAKTKLAALEIENSDVKVDAAIAKTKLAPLEIVDADVKADAAIVDTKLAAIPQSKVTDLETDLTGKVGTGPLTGDKKITDIGWDEATGEIVVDHEA